MKKGQGGFTLIELLIAVAVSSIIVAALYSAFFLSQRAVEGTDESLLKLHELRSALDAMRREIESAAQSKAQDAAAFSVNDRDFYGKQASGLSLTTFSSPAPGLLKIGYRVVEEEGRLILVKSMSRVRKGAAVVEAPVIEDVESFSVEVKDGVSYLKTWDKPGLPAAVKISIAVRSGKRRLALSETASPMVGGRI